MFDDILRWVSLIAGILTVLAASATLYAVWIAHTTWKTWKTQQNYSFERDKVFELEMATDQLFKQAIYYIITVKDLIKAKLEGNFEEFFFEKELKLRLSKLQDCLIQYDLKLSSIGVLKITYDKEILVSATQISNHFDDIVKKMYEETDAQKSLQYFDQKYIIQANIAKDLVLKHLREIRENI